MMKIFVLLFISPLTILAQNNYPTLLETYIKSAVDVNSFNGNVLVAKSENIVYKKSFGYADFGSTIPLENESLFDIGRLTEQFTSEGILLLEEAGKLKLSDLLIKYLPAFPYKNISIQQLLTHSSGLPDYYEIMKGKWGVEKLANNNDLLSSLSASNSPLLFEPGKRYEYSYTNYPVLASIIERISGESYAAFMQTKRFQPLGLGHTKVLPLLSDQKAAFPKHTEGCPYDEAKQKFVTTDKIKQFDRELDFIIKGVVGGTGISTTTEDLLLWDRALKNNLLLKASNQKKMFSSYWTIDSVHHTYYGFGTFIGKNELGRYIQIFDGGNYATLGYAANLVRYTDEDISIILLTNRPKNTSMIDAALAYILFDKEVIPLYVHKAVEIDTTLLEKFTGHYNSPVDIELIKKNGSLYWHWTWTGEPDLEFLPESATKFFSASKEYDYQFDFVMDESGKVTNAYFIRNGVKMQMKKVP